MEENVVPQAIDVKVHTEVPEVQSAKNTNVGKQIVVLLILLLLVTGGFIYFFTQNSQYHAIQMFRSDTQRRLDHSITPSMSPSPAIVSSAISCKKSLSGWKQCESQDFSISVPESWRQSFVNGGYYFTSTPGENNLLIIESTTKPDPHIIGMPDNVKVQQITVNGELATQYYGCFGVEGCLDEYIVRVQHDTRYFEIHYTPYSQPISVYTSIFSSFTFTH